MNTGQSNRAKAAYLGGYSLLEIEYPARAAIDAGAKLSQVNVNGHTAIDIAVSNNHFKVANYLVFARRIEQQIKGNYSGRINSVQQSSPEAAPIVKNSASDLLTPRDTPKW